MSMQMERLLQEIEDCEKCKEDDKCEKHAKLMEEARRREAMLSDPQRNRIGVQGDPVPDSEYGDRK